MAWPVPDAMLQSGLQVFGVPPQFVFPAASNASAPVYTTPWATVGGLKPPAAVQSALHVFGVPEQLVFPAASNAYSLSAPT